jgi:transglutaminase-like putative cysteine protease
LNRVNYMGLLEESLKPTYLCDFDQEPAIGEIARQLTEEAIDRQQMVDHIYHFVKELPYVLEDWDVKASKTLRKRLGMCLEKTNLMVAMLRSIEIPARYRLFKILSEGTLWRWVARQDKELAAEMGDPATEQDHVVAEVYLDGWHIYDPTRDSALERGMKRLGIPLRRRPVAQTGENPIAILLSSIDEWAMNRQRNRRFRDSRELVFSRINKEFDTIRVLGQIPLTKYSP